MIWCKHHHKRFSHGLVGILKKIVTFGPCIIAQRKLEQEMNATLLRSLRNSIHPSPKPTFPVHRNLRNSENATCRGGSAVFFYIAVQFLRPAVRYSPLRHTILVVDYCAALEKDLKGQLLHRSGLTDC